MDVDDGGGEIRFQRKMMAKKEEEEEEEKEDATRLAGTGNCTFSSSSGVEQLEQGRVRLTLPMFSALAPHPHRHSSSKQLYDDTPQTSGRRKRHRNSEFNEHVEANHFLRVRAEEALARSSVMTRAQEVQANLAVNFPSFVRIMLPSAVYRGFWVTLPKDFCQLHLPGHDTMLTLVGEIEKEYRINYLGQRRALSGGWKRFSEEHKLVAGDVLVFHLVRPSKFKVYIVRVNCLGEVDAALGLINLHFHGNRSCSRVQHSEYTVPQGKHPAEAHRNKLLKLQAEGNEARMDMGSNCNDLEGVWSPGLYFIVNNLRGVDTEFLYGETNLLASIAFAPQGATT